MTEATLYERLGGEDRIRRIAETIFDKHKANPAIQSRYADSNREKLIPVLTDFICAGTGGPQTYNGKDMVSAHRGMNVSNDEYMAVLDDIVMALEEHEVGQREVEEFLAISFSLRGEILNR